MFFFRIQFLRKAWIGIDCQRQRSMTIFWERSESTETLMTLSKTLKTCFRSSWVSFSASLLIISSTNSWKIFLDRLPRSNCLTDVLGKYYSWHKVCQENSWAASLPAASDIIGENFVIDVHCVHSATIVSTAQLQLLCAMCTVLLCSAQYYCKVCSVTTQSRWGTQG